MTKFNNTNEIILSICIPTRNRSEILRETLSSIFKSNANKNHFEVIIYDTSDDLETLNLYRKEFNLSNVIYTRGADKGYLNLIESLKLGKGKFLKLHNDYSIFNHDAIEKLILLVKSNEVKQPLIFFSNGLLKSGFVEQVNSMDSLMSRIDYLCTWSTLFGIWKHDFIKLNHFVPDKMFPHTSILLQMNFKDSYIINNQFLFSNSPIKRKGGYDIFRVFSVDFLNLLNNSTSNGVISQKTFLQIKHNLIADFFVKWYAQLIVFKNEYTFETQSLKKSILSNYSYWDLIYLVFSAYLYSMKLLLKKYIPYVNGRKK